MGDSQLSRPCTGGALNTWQLEIRGQMRMHDRYNDPAPHHTRAKRTTRNGPNDRRRSGQAHNALRPWQDRRSSQAHNALCPWPDRWSLAGPLVPSGPQRACAPGRFNPARRETRCVPRRTGSPGRDTAHSAHGRINPARCAMRCVPRRTGGPGRDTARCAPGRINPATRTAWGVPPARDKTCCGPGRIYPARRATHGVPARTAGPARNTNILEPKRP